MIHLGITLQLDPNHFRANLLSGRILSLQGDPLGALPNLERAVQLEPRSAEAHQFLAEAYSQLGQDANAARARRGRAVKTIESPVSSRSLQPQGPFDSADFYR